MLAYSFSIESSSKLLVTRTGIKARTSSISGLWFPWPIYIFLKWDLTLAHQTQVSDRCPLGYLFFIFPIFCFARNIQKYFQYNHDALTGSRFYRHMGFTKVHRSGTILNFIFAMEALCEGWFSTNYVLKTLHISFPHDKSSLNKTAEQSADRIKRKNGSSYKISSRQPPQDGEFVTS